MRQFLFLVLMMLHVQGNAQSNGQEYDPEWPCIQVLVPEIVTAVYWPEYVPEEQVELWKKDPELVTLVEELAGIDEYTDEVQQRIEQFAESVPESARIETLNTVAEGIVATANKRRDKYISGIKRYTRQQISISKQIESSLNKIAELDNDPNSSDNSRRQEIEETLAWHERVYDQREHAIVALCEVPVELEVKLSSVVRELAQYLP